MTLGKEQEIEARRVYDLYWEGYLTGDEAAFASTLDDEMSGIWTAENEVFDNRADIIKCVQDTADQVVGKADFRNRSIIWSEVNGYFLISETSDLYILIDGTWTFYSKIRVSTLMRKVEGEWKIRHQHGSLPDPRVAEGETFAPEQIKQENYQLREAIKRRTIELETKNRELELEACLERVRAQAMGMKKPEDLLGVCEVVYKELGILNFPELRNTMIDIYQPEHNSFTNYDYSDALGPSVTNIASASLPEVEHRVKMFQSSTETFQEHIISGKELEDLKEFRRRNGEKEDPRLDQHDTLYYYFYSIGIGDIGISTFKALSEAQHEVLKRFRNVFDFAYRKYLDVVQAEARTREALVEASLERVRSIAMSMKKPADMLEVCHTISDQLLLLGVTNIRNVQTAILNEEKGTYLNYEYFTQYDTTSIAEIVTKLHPRVEEFANEIMKAKDAFFTTSFSGEELKTWIAYRKQTNQNADPILEQATSVHYYFYSIGPGALGLSTYARLRDDDLGVFKRFRNVFDLAYRRFIDIELAEAHAQEARIELSLERVRARSLAMHRSDELVEASDVFFEQLNALGIASIRTGVATFDQLKETVEVWSRSHSDGKSASKILGVVPIDSHPFFKACFEAWKQKQPYYVQEFRGDEVPAYYHAMGKVLSYPVATSFNPEEWFYTFFFAEGSINVVRQSKLTDDEAGILQRFGAVFGQMYRRFLDLQTAEAQAREAKIEAALERVRSRTMAMQKSEELSATSFVLFEQLKQLGEVGNQVTIGIFDEDEETMTMYATSYGTQWQRIARVPYQGHEVLRRIFSAWKDHKRSLVVDLEGEELASYNAFRSKLRDAQYTTGTTLAETRWIIHTALFSRGQISFSTTEPRPREMVQLLERFAAVFDLTYTRFLDLKQAEAQAREATIEAALERVRAKAMAMRDSSDLSATTSLVFAEMRKLGINSERSGVVLLLEGTPLRGTVYATATAVEGEAPSLVGTWLASSHPVFQQQYDYWLRKESFVTTLKNEELRSYYDAIYSQLLVPQPRPEVGDREEYGYFFPFSEGWFYAWTKERYTEDQQAVLGRFKSIVELTFRRYQDIQRAEAQAREAQIEASLERVRSRTLAMQKSDELAETAAVVFRQLIALGIAPNRLYIAIIKDDAGHAEFWITDEDGSKVSSAFETDLTNNETFRKMFAGWKSDKSALTIDMQGEELQAYFRQLSTINVPFKGGLSQTRRVQTIAYFSKGFIGIASPTDQPVETTTLLERFAAVFNLTFTRFNDLKLAEAQAHQAHLDLIQLQTEKKRAEDALTELRATQEQLLQQEKLASLGQLTAGIAHEIKNPLNFVNNFSSVSVELLDELAQEIKSVAPESSNPEIPLLLADIRTNLNKIIQHGTRADGIVKSMLQHSRGGSGKKEPVDLNGLVKEFANLAFHGMRAGKNPINVDIVLELDEATGKVPVIAEDFSRVIINLCQNAMDAMRDKLNAGNGGGATKSYLPKLTCRTKRDGSRVVVSVEDNGPGIPEAIKEKIMQPFFTTKKGTQGTGLGLSITHDIVKAHGGEMTIGTSADGGASFVITLPAELSK